MSETIGCNAARIYTFDATDEAIAEAGEGNMLVTFIVPDYTRWQAGEYEIIPRARTQEGQP